MVFNEISLESGSFFVGSQSVEFGSSEVPENWEVPDCDFTAQGRTFLCGVCELFGFQLNF